MQNRQEIEMLRERVRAAKGHDFPLNQHIERMEYGADVIPFTADYTGSIDAALALVWRTWPHANFELSCAANEGSYCLLTMPTDGGEIHLGDAEGNTPCLTILDAVLTALLSGSEA